MLISNVMTVLQISDLVLPHANIPDSDQEYLTPAIPATDNQFKYETGTSGIFTGQRLSNFPLPDWSLKGWFWSIN